jgi:hypothetical protein
MIKTNYVKNSIFDFPDFSLSTRSALDASDNENFTMYSVLREKEPCDNMKYTRLLSASALCCSNPHQNQKF